VQKPPPLARRSLTPGELFKELRSSVYTVAMPDSQGSAVAVSSRELVTNCHVVAFAEAITLINGDRTLKAEVVSADQATDRCFLRIQTGELQPVSGVREYSSLTVGEAVYTLGSPKGLVSTLGSGLLSGLRTGDDGTEYIQITAPLSDGSSGGGLFDDQGNLIGVTTFTIRDAQSLNFAIAASQFWK
jgi:S1-C subfamily serine protease